MSSTPTMPTICRLVVFHYFDAGVDRIVDRPAVITSIPNDSGAELRVNLHVFFEPHDVDRDATALRDGFHEIGFRSNVKACHADPLRPPTPRSWSWPLRF